MARLDPTDPRSRIWQASVPAAAHEPSGCPMVRFSRHRGKQRSPFPVCRSGRLPVRLGRKSSSSASHAGTSWCSGRAGRTVIGSLPTASGRFRRCCFLRDLRGAGELAFDGSVNDVSSPPPAAAPLISCARFHDFCSRAQHGLSGSRHSTRRSGDLMRSRPIPHGRRALRSPAGGTAAAAHGRGSGIPGATARRSGTAAPGVRRLGRCRTHRGPRPVARGRAGRPTGGARR